MKKSNYRCWPSVTNLKPADHYVAREKILNGPLK